MYIAPGPNQLVLSKSKPVTSDIFILASGSTPKLPDIPRARKLAITTDHLFSLKCPPGKTLIIGGGKVALECAGFLRGLGFDTSIMVKSIFLKGFDQQIAKKIIEYMEEQSGVNMVSLEMRIGFSVDKNIFLV